MKKILAFLFAAMLLLSAVGCGGASGKTETATDGKGDTAGLSNVMEATKTQQESSANETTNYKKAIIAIALACNPKMLIADEPTTALDVTIQAQVLELINNLKRERGTGTLMITHDLGIVAESCDNVAVMYAGRIIEMGTLDEVFNKTKHPYH